MSDERLYGLEFPTAYPIKAFGRQEEGFVDVVTEIVRRHAVLDDRKVSTRPSREGTYISVTAVILAESRAQLEAIYQDLADHPAVLMVL